jgi:hypothetical protein
VKETSIFTDPAISEIVVTSGGAVLVQQEGEVGSNEIIGGEADLNRNPLTLIEAAGLPRKRSTTSAAVSEPA